MGSQEHPPCERGHPPPITQTDTIQMEVGDLTQIPRAKGIADLCPPHDAIGVESAEVEGVEVRTVPLLEDGGQTVDPIHGHIKLDSFILWEPIVDPSI